jgi:hypothetical protein
LIARREGLEPSAVLKHPLAIHEYLRLNVQVATLAKRRDIPPFVVARIEIQVVDRQNMSGQSIVLMAATNAFPSGRILYRLGYFGPIRGVSRN